MSQFTAQQLADLLNGTIEGNAQAIVSKLSKIEEGVAQSVSFLSNPVYTPYIYTTDASVVIVANDLQLEKPVKSTCTLIRVTDPRASFGVLLDAYNQINDNKKGIEQPSFISASATIGKDPYIGAFTYIGDNVRIGDNVKIYPNSFIGNNVVIGDNTFIFPGVKIHTDSVIGKNCTFHSGVIIGGDGFGFAPNSENNYKKIPQIGNVIIEDHVEIGSNSTIDRATLGSTIIRKGVKLDNLIQIGHNVEIGENTVIVAQTGVAGSTKIGKNCIIAGQVGIVGHITIADGVKIAAQSGVGNSIKVENEIVQGSPAFKQSDYKRSFVVFRNLPKINTDLNELKRLKSDTLSKE
ncbi:MAG TPA: UDP-3-O-(3-hydroxymyristoyl)glucosamine N-acyltransferase [Bacteroidia bacterium]|jgi:UDP-3-O-[3-hydroxymyristoyl] glucosamine N-acyltransferase|nr:UDP-3-O-(3-hydroxymyristoyl)glucosamine N-acyltransferase [Bacteroidia bacterium]